MWAIPQWSTAFAVAGAAGGAASVAAFCATIGPPQVEVGVWNARI